MKFAAIINPEVRKPAPKPVRVDLRKTFLIGCVLWSVALIVSAILLACGLDVLQLLIMCAAGLIIGAGITGVSATEPYQSPTGSDSVNVLPCPGALHTVTSP